MKALTAAPIALLTIICDMGKSADWKGEAAAFTPRRRTA